MSHIVPTTTAAAGNAIDVPTGRRTWLHNLVSICRKGSCMYLPKNRKSSIGVMKIPDRLLMTAFHRAVATLPLAAVVRITHMLTVVGRQVRIRSPSRSGGLSRLGRNFSRNAVMGRPTSRGHKPNVVNSTEAFSLWFDAAC